MVKVIGEHLVMFNLLFTVKDSPALDAKQLAVGLLFYGLKGVDEGQPALGADSNQVALERHEAPEL